MAVTIYALADARGIRYVGYSNSPKVRYRQHLSRRESSAKGQWIQLLKAQGQRPELRVLEEVDEADRWQAERRWIAHYRPTGLLLNHVGGGGQAQLYTDEDVLAALRKHSQTPYGITNTEWVERRLRPSPIVIYRRFDSWENALVAAGFSPRPTLYKCGHDRVKGVDHEKRRCPQCALLSNAEREARIEYAVRAYKDGLSLHKVAAALGHKDHSTVLRVLQREGVTRRARGGGRGVPHCSICRARGHNRRTCTNYL